MGPRKRFDEGFESGAILRQMRKILGQRALEVQVGEIRRRTVARPGDQQYAGAGSQNQAIQMRID